MKKENYALIIGILIGLIIGVSSTYLFMKDIEDKIELNNEKEKLSITEKFELEITKLGLKNRTYVYVDTIESAIVKYNSANEKNKIKKSMFAFDKSGFFYEIDINTNEKVENGKKLEIEFEDKTPNTNTVIIVSDKGKIEEAVFLVENNFQIKYNLIGTTVTKLEDN